MNQFKLCQTVVLNSAVVKHGESDSPVMTVIGLKSDGGVTCKWTGENAETCKQTFRPEQLKHVLVLRSTPMTYCGVVELTPVAYDGKEFKPIGG